MKTCNYITVTYQSVGNFKGVSSVTLYLFGNKL